MSSALTECVYLRAQCTIDMKSNRIYAVSVYPREIRCIPVDSPVRRTGLLRSNGSSAVVKMRCITLEDVVGCNCQRGSSEQDVAAYLVVFAYPRHKPSGSGRENLSLVRHRKTLTLRFAEHEQYERNLEEASKWRNVVTGLLRKVSIEPESDLLHIELPCPPKLLVLVNPFSGPGRALHIFQRQIVPVFVEAGLHYQLVVTEHAGHARELVKTINLAEWSGIAIVSGDGLIFEVINGLMEREDWNKAIKMPLAALPGGSGNALSCAISHDSGESYLKKPELHAAFVVAKHSVVPMDLVAIDTSSGQRLYSFLSVGWGMMADVDIESEKYRSMGHARFTLMAVMKIAGMKTYRGKLSYLPVSADVQQSLNVETSGSAGDVEMRGPVPTPLLTPLNCPLPDGWVSIEDDFLLVGVVYQSHLAKDNRMAVNARLDDGVIHIIYTRSAVTSRMRMVQMLASLENGLRVSGEGDTVLVQALAFRLEPASNSPPGIMTVDGESIEYGPIQGQVLPSMARVMSIRCSDTQQKLA